MLFARNVDGVVLSVLRNVSQIDAVAAARDRLASMGVKALGVVVNGFDGPMYREAIPYYRLPSVTHEQTARV
jgi:Mrp family chromosome partitioning ATPase